nr:hypothetical protein [Tanacetum cinerariifolium]
MEMRHSSIKKLLYQLCWKHVMIQAQTSARKTEEVVVSPEKIIDPAKQEEATYKSCNYKTRLMENVYVVTNEHVYVVTNEGSC